MIFMIILAFHCCVINTHADEIEPSIVDDSSTDINEFSTLPNAGDGFWPTRQQKIVRFGIGSFVVVVLSVGVIIFYRKMKDNKNDRTSAGKFSSTGDYQNPFL